ncbi:unnamed protein product [Phytophthora fragariaefolia]|uniref:Unnamed protein product n=1 Tax=Phytophthora fragariaefolia TaxID=1490495 RepID=A0A9W6TQ56_9STRA|nr:unnamed protein product [Phytophthora fragariaefolia]
MNLSMVRGMLEQVGRRHPSYSWTSSGAHHSEVSESDFSESEESAATQPSEASDDTNRDHRHGKPCSDADLLKRARDAHRRVDFKALSAGPNVGGPWKRVEAADRFVVFRRQESKVSIFESMLTSKIHADPEVLCAGRLDACLDEVLSILCPHTEAEHNAVMTVLYDKRFLCGSVERIVPCSADSRMENNEHGEHLVVKTSSFAGSTLFSANEQWCFTDFFQRKNERDGFTISLNSLGRYEATPGRMTGTQTRVDQLHDLNAAFLVDLDPGRKGLRVVYRAKFLTDLSDRDRSTSNQSTNSDTPSSPAVESSAEIKAHNSTS